MRNLRGSQIIATILIVIGVIVILIMIGAQSSARAQFEKEYNDRLNIATNSESAKEQKSEILRVVSYLHDHTMDQYTFDGSSIPWCDKLEEIASNITNNPDKDLGQKLRLTKFVNTDNEVTYVFDTPNGIQYGSADAGYWTGYIFSIIFLVIGLIIFIYTYFYDEYGYRIRRNDNYY